MDKAGQEGREAEEDINHDFQYVTRKIKANRKRRKGRGEGNDYDDDAAVKLARRINIIDAQKTFLKAGAIGASFQKLLDDTFLNSQKDQWPSSILILGLGSIKDSKAAQTQLAFLLIIRDHLQEKQPLQSIVKVEAYDPIFDIEDDKVLEAYNITKSSDNLQGKYTLESSVFVFMPHCTKTLYENILRCNWSPTGLDRLWLCCNELVRYLDDSKGRDSDLFTPCIQRFVERSSVCRLPSLPSSHNGALNDLAMQRYCPLPYQAIDDLTSRLSSATLLSNECHQNSNGASFFDLPSPPAINDKDPELL